MTEVRPEKGAWAIVILLFLFMLINFADKAIIGLAGVPIMTELNLTPKQFGLVGSSFFLLFSVSAVVTGFIVNRVQVEVGVAGDGAGLVAGSIPDARHRGNRTADRLPHCAGGRRGPCLSRCIACGVQMVPGSDPRRSRCHHFAGSRVGVVIAIPLLNSIITTTTGTMPSGDWASWAWSGSPPGRFLARKAVSESGRQPGVQAASRALPYRDLLLNLTNLASWCAYFGAYFGLALVLSWFTPYLVKGLGFEQAIAGKLTALPFVAGFFVVLGGSWLSQRMMQRGSSSRSARGIFCGVAICLGGLALLVAPYAPERRNNNSPDYRRNDASVGRLLALSGHPE